MIKKPVTIQTDMSKEDRSVALLVQEASQYQSQVFFEVEEKKINAKSIMGIIAFNPSEGMNVTIAADGNDEGEAVEALEKFFICQ